MLSNSMSSSQDFTDIQQQLKKTIMAHQIAVSKLQTDPQNPILQKELHELQTTIKTLSEEQKNKIQSLKQQIVFKEKTAKEHHNNNLLVDTLITSSTVGGSGNNNSGVGTGVLVSSNNCNKDTQNKSSPAVGSAASAVATTAATTAVTTTAAAAAPVIATNRPALIIPKLTTSGHRVIGNVQTSGGIGGHHHNHQAFTSNKRPALAIKSITGQTQFLVPVANSGGKNKLVVVPKQKVLNYLKPVGGGGGQTTTTNKPMPILTNNTNNTTTTTTTSSSSAASLVTKTISSANHNNNNNNTLVSTINTRGAALALKSAAMAAKHSSSSTSLLMRSKIGGNVSVKNTSPVTTTAASVVVRPAVPKLTEKQSKDHFMSCLGLVTKETLTELQSRKCERKRRTTANPQFSSAALEAKRITKLELAERKAKRRLMINNSYNIAANNPGPGRPPNNPLSSINNNNKSSVAAAAAANHNISKPNNNSITSQNTAPVVNGGGGGNQNKSNNNNNASYLNSSANPKSIGVEQQELAPGLYIVTSIGKHLSANCHICEELCECDIDSILFCKPCKTLFHAMCTTTVDDLKNRQALPKCPKCDAQRRLVGEQLAKKRRERDCLVKKKQEFDDQLQQMRKALQTLKLKIKEKNDEKLTLVGRHEIVQKRVDKIIETLKIVEDTGEWDEEDNENLQPPTLVAVTAETAIVDGDNNTNNDNIGQTISGGQVSNNNNNDDQQSSRNAQLVVFTGLSSPPPPTLELHTMDNNSKLDDVDDAAADEDEDEAMDVEETSRAIEQLEKINRGELEDNNNNNNADTYEIDLRCDERPELVSLSMDDDDAIDHHNHHHHLNHHLNHHHHHHRPSGIGSKGHHQLYEQLDNNSHESNSCADMYDMYVEEVVRGNRSSRSSSSDAIGGSGGGSGIEAMDAENVAFFDTDLHVTAAANDSTSAAVAGSDGTGAAVIATMKSVVKSELNSNSHNNNNNSVIEEHNNNKVMIY
ncbi:PHD finger protein 21A-like isoform X1 [Oppia nitens]|uniref:PHD finger protein 21A-like isoform X1 n=1 Tax=Oppia nitens TaxID=1686743 RepID=UPI0023DBB710|nr:PHD finger protein 21A-like isoform X1 [Oppia nitens]